MRKKKKKMGITNKLFFNQTLKTEICRDAKFVVTGGSTGCRFDSSGATGHSVGLKKTLSIK